MNSRKSGALFMVFLVGLVSAAIGNASVIQDIPRDFFINPETGKPAVVIVVGSEAAPTDVESATVLAAAIGSKITSKASHKNINTLFANLNGVYRLTPELECIGFSTVDVPDANLYAKQEDNVPPINYTLQLLWYFDDTHGFWGNNNEHFDPWETHEEIQVRFDADADAGDINSHSKAACLYNEILCVNSPDELGLSWYTVPGLIYRADNIFVPPSVMAEWKYQHPLGPHIVGLGETGRLFPMPEPWMVIHGRLPQFNLFNTVYTVVDGGPVWDMSFRTVKHGPLYGTPYLVTGEPHFRTQICLYKNKPVEFGLYAVELTDIDLNKNVVWLETSRDGEFLEIFWMRPDPLTGFPQNLEKPEFPFDFYDTCFDLNGNGKLDPGEITRVVDYDYNNFVWGTAFRKWIIGCAEEDVWVDYEYEYYKDDRDEPWLLFTVTEMVIDGVRIFTDDQGEGLEVQVYWLENKKTWYNRLCGDPWALEPTYQLFLDSYQTSWDDMDENSYTYQPPGTGLWPQKGLLKWEDEPPWTYHYGLFIGNGFLDSNDGHTGYEYNCFAGYFSGAYLPEQNDLDRDGGFTNDCRTSNWLPQEHCTDSCDIEDPGIWHGPGIPVVELNIFLCENLCHPDYVDIQPVFASQKLLYFAIEVTDAFFCEDGIAYDTILINAKERGLIILDYDFDFFEWKETCNYNLVLIGGPVANKIVRHVVNDGISVVDWETSSGEWEYIENPYSSCDILIVAGADREATRKAVQELINHF